MLFQLAGSNSAAIEKLLKSQIGGVLKAGGVIAGGWAREYYKNFIEYQELPSLVEMDLDIFTQSEQSKRAIVKELEGLACLYRHSRQLYHKPEIEVRNYSSGSLWQTNLRGLLQLIDCRQSPEELLGDFDFTVCQICITEDGIYCAKEFLVDEPTGRLRINNLIDTPAFLLSIHRIAKYLGKGYRPDEESVTNAYLHSIDCMVKYVPEENWRDETEKICCLTLGLLNTIRTKYNENMVNIRDLVVTTMIGCEHA